MTVGAALLSGNADQLYTSVAGSIFTILLGVLISFGLVVPLMAAYWFAPALVIMHDVKPMAAMRESFLACFRNFMPFLVYGIIMFVLAIVAALPFGLGFLVLVPVAMASVYVQYRQIFTDAVETAPTRSTL
jgi:uncharacterized membrane protein